MGNSNGKPIVLTDEVNLNHFRLLRVVGKGAFGKVRIVERKDTGLTFALKYIRKDEVVRSESVRNIIRERRMLQSLHHPFLCNLRYSFQDIEYLYIVVDLMNGGDLRFHISRKTFTEEAVRFWIAELGCALDYIHKQGIVHRDIKPDNVLLDSEGHIHLTDFNVASDLVPGKPLSSKSGTLAYLAPEVYAGKGYYSEVDWWSLGVLFYECIYNRRPFEANNADTLAAAIIKGVPPFPHTNPPVSNPCLHAISSLLEKNKKKRIGAIGFDTFCDNPFFRDIDFEALERKEIEPIFCPSSDKTNFDATYDLEELLLEEAPLEARARKQKPRAGLRNDATQQEIRAEELHRMIETMFEPFNYTIATAQEQAQPEASTESTSTTTITPAGAGVSQSRPHTRNDDDRAQPRTEKQSLPIARSQTPGSMGSHTQSSTRSPNGSPPLPIAALSGDFSSMVPAPCNGVSVPTSHSGPRSSHSVSDHQKSLNRASTFGRPEDVLDARSGSPTVRPRGPQRSASMSGHAHFNELGTWSDLANSANNKENAQQRANDRPTGIVGFLTRKKGRDRSPRAKERGVLGKEGARVIVKDPS